MSFNNFKDRDNNYNREILKRKHSFWRQSTQRDISKFLHLIMVEIISPLFPSLFKVYKCFVNLLGHIMCAYTRSNRHLSKCPICSILPLVESHTLFIISYINFKCSISRAIKIGYHISSKTPLMKHNRSSMISQNNILFYL